jgi:hypothetical protein
VVEGIKKLWAEFFTCGIWDGFASGSTTRAAMGRRRLQIDWAHQKGPEIPFHRILMLVVGCGTGGEEVLGGIFHSQKLEMFPLVAQQPAVLW